MNPTLYESIVRIALVSSGSPEFDRFPNGGGIQHQIGNVAQELAQLGHEPIIVTRDMSPDLPDEISSESARVVLCDEVLSRIEFSQRVSSILTDIEPDIVFTYERFSALFPCQGSYPTLFFTSNYDAMTFYKPYALERHSFNYILFPIKKRVEEYVMHQSDQVIALNSDIKEYLHDRGIDHTSVVPNAVNPSDYQKSDEGDFILYAGRLNGVKNVQILIEAFDKIAPEYPDLMLRITGDGEEKKRLEKQVRGLDLADRVEFMGWVDRATLHEYFSRCQAFILPSEFETFGIVVIEAMASGTPVVATDIMGPRNIITHGEDGLLVQPGDVDELKRAINTLLRNQQLREKLGNNARKNIVNKYSFRVIAEDLTDIADRLVN